jgi:hypothetical protein
VNEEADEEAQASPEGGAEPSQEELRARLEDQIRKLRVQDLLVESTVSVLNLTARRIAKEDERDLEQARVGIDAVRAWVELLPEDAAGQIRNALSELQMLYAQAVEGKPLGETPSGEEAARPEPEAGEAPTPPPAGGPSQGGEGAPSRLWTPPGSS